MQTEKKHVQWLQPQPLIKSVAFVLRYGAATRRYRNQSWQWLEKLILEYAVALPADLVLGTAIQRDKSIAKTDACRHIYDLSRALHSGAKGHAIVFPCVCPGYTPRQVLATWIVAEATMDPGLHSMVVVPNKFQAESWAPVVGRCCVMDEIMTASREGVSFKNGSTLGVVSLSYIKYTYADVRILFEAAWAPDACREGAHFLVVCTRSSE